MLILYMSSYIFNRFIGILVKPWNEIIKIAGVLQANIYI